MSDVIARIEAKLDKSAGQDGCWLWLGAVGQKGGPKTSINKRHANPRRIVWEFVHGEPLPRTRQVATTCEVPRCLNPAHLYLRPWCDDVPRFWTHVQKGDGCWLWKSTLFASGYGAFKMKGKERQAHRVSYELANGVELTDITQVIMHTCDNPPCVNPAHLRLGTHAENVADMWSKGRGSRGAEHAAKCAAGGSRRSSPFTRVADGDASKERP